MPILSPNTCMCERVRVSERDRMTVFKWFLELFPHLKFGRQKYSPAPKHVPLVETMLLCRSGQEIPQNTATSLLCYSFVLSQAMNGLSLDRRMYFHIKNDALHL